MKTFRVLGAIFCVLGCIFALLGMLTIILPMIENEQFKLILSSFQTESADPLTNTLNSIILFCLHSGYFLFFCGISLTVAGALISVSAHKRQKSSQPAIPEIVPLAKTSQAIVTPKPAYYPGGMEPPEPSLAQESLVEPANVVSTMKTPLVALIDDADEPDMTSIEDDAEKLMRNDAVYSAQEQFMRPPEPDYTRYPSNSVPSKLGNSAAFSPESKLKQRPKIISTMGKNHQ